ncbi:HNH endonuclease [Streptomyces sp. NPDC091219]|uniref:HNH endonuclease n=1 Tax=Streptomyces sp. NPDC091219 TaxID=3155193 RepID=UPI003450AB14
MSNSVLYTRERLTEAASRCSDIDDVIAFFGTQPYGQLRRHLFRRFDHFGIDVSHMPRRRRSHTPPDRPTSDELRRAVAGATSIADRLRAQRGQSGGVLLRHAENILVQHDGSRRTRTHLLRRALLEVGIPEVCAECGTAPEWLGRPMTLEVDHVNGDWSDDRRENLRLLCPNCHAITSTWCRGGRQRSCGAQ